MKPIQVLQHIISSSTNGLNKLFQQHHAFGEHEANARHALLYMNVILPFYKQNHRAIPINEFTLLIQTMQSLPADSKLLSELVRHLISFNDILDERAPDENRLQVLTQSISKLPDSVFEQISLSATSPTAGYIHNKLQKPFKIEDKNDVLTLVTMAIKKSQKSYSYTVEDDERILVLLEKKMGSDPVTSEQEFELLELLIKGFGKERFDQKELSLIIHELYNKSKDKETFCKNCLFAYDDVYNSFSRQSEGKNRLLKEVGIILPLLNESLPPDRFNQILLETNFDLADPRAAENDEAYYRYKLIRSFYSEIGLSIKNTMEEKTFLKFIFENECFSYLLQDLGKDAAENIQVSDSKVLSELPLLMQHSLLNKSELVQKEFTKFIALFLRVNKDAPEHQQRNIKLFFSKHQHAVDQIIDTMGVEGIYYLQNHLAGTVLNLERTLESVVILPAELQHQLADYFAQCDLSNKANPDQMKAFKTCMIVLGALINAKAHGEYVGDEIKIAQFYLAIAKGKSPQDFLLALAQILLEKIMLERGGQLDQEQITKIFERMEPTRFVQLAAASQHMADDPYREVYLNLLKLDLIGGDIDDFLHNTAQKNEVGQDLARHNNSIRANLETKGISPKTALNYQRHYDFIVTAGDEAYLNKGNQYVVLWTYLNKLWAEAKEDLDSGKITNEKNRTRLNAILSSIGELDKIVKGMEAPSAALAIVNAFGKSHAQPLVNKIISNIEALKVNKAETSSTFNEFAEHSKDQVTFIDELEKQKEKTKTSNKVGMHYFSVEQWSKEKLMTFFLGDEVGCCLATTSAQFQAMVQRRMDDALLFHVAVDKITGRPAALIWLYLAETKEGKVVLMANFFEVNTKYAVNDTLRLSLLNGLLKFTQQYCEDNPGIDAFYMNPLTYGWNERDLDTYPIVDLPIADKVGGPYLPGVSGDQIDLADPDVREEIEEMTRQKYYLVSLDRGNFHQFSPDVLAKNISPNTLEKESVLEKAVVSIAEKEESFDKIILAVITQHSLELAPFYSTPIEKDKNFAEDVYKAFQKVVLEEKSADLNSIKASNALRFFPNPDAVKTTDDIPEQKYEPPQ